MSELSTRFSTKLVGTPYPVLPAIANRWSPSCFDVEAIPDEALQSMFAAMRLSPSAHNAQPVRAIVCRKENQADFQRAIDCLYPKNQEWAQTAPVLVLLAAANIRLSHRDATYVNLLHSWHDVGLALMAFMLQGQSVSPAVYTHPIAGFDEKQAAELFKIPPGFDPVVMVAVGFPGEPVDQSEMIHLREAAPRTRRPLQELIYEGQWMQPTSLLKDCPSH